ncbi:hypothetical protein HMPREF9714_02575 [Myroides odoratimimus CCUG 12901]|uniref:hypothetical protein n=1 Tax=Myroides odoratimimus TaxID=76832 RepID=UPI0002460773|nr:hypothetical protein HMPREF9714_02575 [Myroides odoratimimus CCUG 12901]MEC4150711.1 hypothetical protein [Myroides odoratimimus]
MIEGGNVFFGDHDDDNSTDEVLYIFVMNPTTGKREKKIINLAETIREIFKHEVVTTEISEALGYNQKISSRLCLGVDKQRLVYLFDE